MTREEAIKVLNGILHLNYRNFWDEECDEAIDIAIKALSEDKTDRMTREEAIADIKNNIKPVVGGKSLDMAIEALSEPINCVKCKHYYETEDDTDVHGHCRMDTAHTNPISKAVQGCDINKGAWVIPISLIALTVAVVGLLAKIKFLFL